MARKGENMATNKPSIYLKPKIREFLESGGSGSLSGRINAALERYAYLVETTPIPAFSDQEIGCLTMVFEDHPEIANTGTPCGIIRYLTKILSHPLNKKVDPVLPPLVKTLEQLSPCQIITLMERIVRQK